MKAAFLKSNRLRASAAVGELFRRLARRILPASTYRALAEFGNHFIVIQRIGFRGFQNLRRLKTRSNSSAMEAIKLRNLAHPLWFRPGHSDAIEVIHTVVRECY